MNRLIRRSITMKSYMPSASAIERKWYVVDAEGQTLGRLASEIAKVLRGKNKPTYTPHIDTGDYVIVVNAEKIKVSGNKLNDKVYYRHSDYVGGLKSVTLKEALQKNPVFVIEHAVKGMLPKGPLGRQMSKKLFVYAGPEHKQQAQQPEALEIKF
jgi:large subunit ribosomal protein L13